MPVQDQNPAEEFPYMHMIEQTVHQSRIATKDGYQDIQLSLAWTWYKINADGTRTYSDLTETAYINDYVQLAEENAAQGDSTHHNTLNAQTLSVADIVSSETGRELLTIAGYD